MRLSTHIMHISSVIGVFLNSPVNLQPIANGSTNEGLYKCEKERADAARSKEYRKDTSHSV